MKRPRAARRAAAPDATQVAALVRALNRHDPHPRCALDYATPFELLCAVILSAQCTDKRVNLVTPALFARYPDAAALAAARQEDVEDLVRTTGFFRNKARNLVGMAQGLVQRFGGRVPQGMDELLSLPGVARKTANVVRGEAYGLADGVVVDTHVTRLAGRLGLTRHADPVKIERDLMALLPHAEWLGFSHRLIRLGRSTCVARKPRCEGCPVYEHCPRVGV
ncbi:MAG: endonuclease III [Planctomycetes bacterium]|nr:endonuclease III [Planctomycetota bacterium]